MCVPVADAADNGHSGVVTVVASLVAVTVTEPEGEPAATGATVTKG